MNFVNIRQDNSFRLGVMRDEHVIDLPDLARQSGEEGYIVSSMNRFLDGGEEARRFVSRLLNDFGEHHRGNPIPVSQLGPPIPNPGKIIAVGLNYQSHANEANFKPPEYPLIFAKFPNSISGPRDAIVLPAKDMEVDSEAELAVVIGRRAKAISVESAYEYVAGYMSLNDVSARKWQFADKQWTRGKSCDTFCPTGPWISTRDDIPDPHNLRITGRLNGVVLQESNTSEVIFRIPELLAFISATITLDPGDIIATGTPSGVGAFRSPPVYLKDGDVTEVEIEKLGKLVNPVRLLAPR